MVEPSNHRSTETLTAFLGGHGKIGVEALATRALTLHIRSAGAMVERIVGRRLRSECVHTGRIPKALKMPA